jgi:ATP-dependent RNA helicase DDX27
MPRVKHRTIASDEELSNHSDEEHVPIPVPPQHPPKTHQDTSDLFSGLAGGAGGQSSWDLTKARALSRGRGAGQMSTEARIQAKVMQAAAARAAGAGDGGRGKAGSEADLDSDPDPDADADGDSDSNSNPDSNPDNSNDDDDSGSEDGGSDELMEEEVEQLYTKRGQTRAKKAPASDYFAVDDNPLLDISSFRELNLSRPLLKAVDALGFAVPTPIQRQAIPVAMAGKDICGAAVTGSGKTAAFLLPVLERLQHRSRRSHATRVLVLLPTRELAIQCHAMCEKLAQFTDVKALAVVGGSDARAQEVSLRARPDIVIATPGRILDHMLNSRAFGLEDVEILILDEADRLLEMGFEAELEQIVRECPKNRQTLLFSATMTEEVERLTKLSLRHPTLVRVNPNINTAVTLTEEFVRFQKGREDDKEAALLALCTRTFKSRCMVFCKTKVHAHRLRVLFGLAGLRAAELHGNLTQAQRLEALEAFRDGQADFLVVTDLAARGLDIVGVQTVINVDMPTDPTTYVHRVGRTARAGRLGRSVTLVTDAERANLRRALTRKKMGEKKAKARQIPPEAIQAWREKLKLMEPLLRQVLDEEKVEKEVRLAERDLAKAENLDAHADEIRSRPKKEWILTNREKEDIKDQTRVSKGLPTAAEREAAIREAREAKAGPKSKKKRRSSVDSPSSSSGSGDGGSGSGGLEDEVRASKYKSGLTSVGEGKKKERKKLSRKERRRKLFGLGDTGPAAQAAYEGQKAQVKALKNAKRLEQNLTGDHTIADKYELGKRPVLASFEKMSRKRARMEVGSDGEETQPDRSIAARSRRAEKQKAPEPVIKHKRKNTSKKYQIKRRKR